MKEIKKKIAEILMSTEEVTQTEPTSDNEMIETFDEYEFEEIYTDIYLSIRNMEDFYGDDSRPKAALLLESFLLESMVLLKKDPEVIVVESGDYFLKSTSFTPDGEGVLHAFENVVLINSMLELYNLALTELEYAHIDAGIGMVAFPREELSCCQGDEECDCQDCEEEDYGIDFHNTALKLSMHANTDEIEPIVVNDMAYEMLQEVDQLFFSTNLERVLELVEDLVVYHGNIVTED